MLQIVFRFVLNIINKRQFGMFLLVGGINTLFGYLAFASMVHIGIHYSFAVLLATICGVLFNFCTTGKFVFNQVKTNLLPKFILVYICTYFLNVGFLWIFDLFKFNMYIAGAMLLLPMAIITFALNKTFVFNLQK